MLRRRIRSIARCIVAWQRRRWRVGRGLKCGRDQIGCGGRLIWFARGRAIQASTIECVVLFHVDALRVDVARLHSLAKVGRDAYVGQRVLGRLQAVFA